MLASPGGNKPFEARLSSPTTHRHFLGIGPFLDDVSRRETLRVEFDDDVQRLFAWPARFRPVGMLRDDPVGNVHPVLPVPALLVHQLDPSFPRNWRLAVLIPHTEQEPWAS